jgi:hypothetical protein
MVVLLIYSWPSCTVMKDMLCEILDPPVFELLRAMLALDRCLAGVFLAAIKLLKLTSDLGLDSPADVIASRLLHVVNVNVTITACCLFNIRHGKARQFAK